MEEAGKLRLPRIPGNCETNYHLFYILLPSEEKRNSLMEKLRNAGIQTVFHYIPLHTSPMGVKLGYRKGDLPITESIGGRLLRLPFFADLGKEEQEFIIATLKKRLF